ncbi:MAG: 2-oxoacid:acceptor oxidoreductase family protein [Clostridiaceae bacterium]|nr:2-oxoacid:acceptor oxidoreductase family protein [Clostridiaceae bacterium]
MKDRYEIALVGIGGQGVITIGKALGEAALTENKNAVQTTEYTDAARGGFSKSEVVISENEIAYPEVLKPDIALALSQQAYEMYKDKGCLLIYDCDAVTPDRTSDDIKGYPITGTAIELNNMKVMNMISFGLVVSLADIVSYGSAVEALKGNVPQKAMELNLKAFNKGFEMGSKQV